MIPVSTGLTGVATIISILAPEVTNLIMLFKHKDGTVSVVVAQAAVDQTLEANAQALKPLMDLVKTAVVPAT